MTGLRRYVLGLFAACVALAAGIALGAGPLQGAASADGSDTSTDTTALRDQITALQGGQRLSSALTEATRDLVTARRLSGASVTMVVLPGVSAAIVDGLSDAIHRAGGTVAVTVRLADRLVDPAQKTYATSVAASSLKGVRDLSRYTHSQPYAQLGALLGRAYVGQGTDLALDDEAIKIDSELQGAHLVSLTQTPHRRGSLVLVVGAGEHGLDDVTAATHVIELQLLSSLTGASDGVLVATPTSGSSPGGLLAALAADPASRRTLSTLNVTGEPAAEVAAVFALAAVSGGATGTYGITGDSVTLPPGLIAHGG